MTLGSSVCVMIYIDIKFILCVINIDLIKLIILAIFFHIFIRIKMKENISFATRAIVSWSNHSFINLKEVLQLCVCVCDRIFLIVYF